jgi:hypothetical protein
VLAREAFFQWVDVQDCFRAVGEEKWPVMTVIFTGSGPTEQYFIARTIFFTGRIFSAGNDGFQARDGLNERDLKQNKSFRTRFSPGPNRTR